MDVSCKTKLYPRNSEGKEGYSMSGKVWKKGAWVTA